MIKIVGIGELLWDLLPDGKKAGGAPVNFAFHASQSGADGYAISAIGDDALGEELLQELNNNKIKYLIEKADYPTGTVQVDLKNGIPQYTINEHVAWDYIPLTEDMKQLVSEADAICFGTLAQRSEVSRNTTVELLKMTKPDAYRLYDINLRQHFYSKELIVKSLTYANAFKINDEEIEILKDIFSIEMENEHVCYWLISQFDLKLVILTAGESYSIIYTPDESSMIETPKVNVADTVGAGDCFSGVLIASLLSGNSLKESHKKAVKAAAHVCSHPGAWIPHPKE
ncbi:carbohydrate kinase [Prevotella sp. 10(H)]|uniref:carbohydrate kinase family protein n=1 Tax=Prevotella sp. 10(H) TaxID=1158294 RepID=UPI0004A6CFBF|nr:carbohydrate kinase [Prevotella sp. 10(H)]